MPLMINGTMKAVEILEKNGHKTAAEEDQSVIEATHAAAAKLAEKETEAAKKAVADAKAAAKGK